MAFTTITVTRRYLDATGAAQSGDVTFAPSAPMQDSTTNVTRGIAPITVALDSSGSISVPLTANDDPSTVPTGTTYEVIERLVGPGGHTTVNAYSVVVPHTAVGGAVALNALAPVANTTVSYGVTSVNGETGAVVIGSSNLDGGVPSDLYLTSQLVDGGLY